MINSNNNKLDFLRTITGENVSRETFLILEEFTGLLLKWNQKINLVSKKINSEELWHRHIFDSAQIHKCVPANTTKIIDLGSGAGFPGLILAIIGGYHVTLIESDQRKCAFMQEAIGKFNLQGHVITNRIEEVKPFHCDLITSRALAPLVKLLEYTNPFMDKDNFMLFLKGQNVVEEIKEASISWDFTYEIFPSALNKDGCVLKISNVRRL